VTLNANLEGDGIVVLELVIAVGFGAVGVSVAKPENFWLRWNHITSAEMSAHRGIPEVIGARSGRRN
jgi:hypothetical protein